MVVRRVPKGRLPPLTFFFIIPLTLATWLAILVLTTQSHGQLLEAGKCHIFSRISGQTQLTVLPGAVSGDPIDEKRDRSRDKCMGNPESDGLAGVAWKWWSFELA
jgi:hypothetical protein